MSVTSLMAEGLFPQFNLQPRLGPLWYSSDVVCKLNPYGELSYQCTYIDLPTAKRDVTVQARRLLSALTSGDTAPLLKYREWVYTLLAFCAITTPHPSISVKVTHRRRGDWSCTLNGLSFRDDDLERAFHRLAHCQHAFLSADLVPVVAPVVHFLGGVVWPDGTAAVPKKFQLVNYTPHALGRVQRQGHGCSPTRMTLPEPVCDDDDTMTLVAQDGERAVLPQRCLAACPFFQCAVNFREGRTGCIALPCDGATLRALAAHVRGSAVPADYGVPLLELAVYLLWDDLVDACLPECLCAGELDAVALATLARHPGLPPASAALVQGVVRGQRAATAAHVYARMALQNRV